MKNVKGLINTVFEYIEETEKPNWEDFHKKYPEFDKWEYEYACKRYQEM